MRRSELERILGRGRIFADLWAVAYFTRRSWNQVDHLYREGRLPKVLNASGEEWRPPAGRLVVVEGLTSMVPGELRVEFERWRRYEFEIEPHEQTDAVPPLLAHAESGSVDMTTQVTANP